MAAVAMPISWQARITRTAISPRLATKTLLNRRFTPLSEDRVAYQGLELGSSPLQLLGLRQATGQDDGFESPQPARVVLRAALRDALYEPIAEVFPSVGALV